MKDVCKMCGKRLSEGGMQCLNCGHVPGVAADPRYWISPTPTPRRSPVGRVLLSMVRIVGIVMIFFTALFAFALHTAHNQPSDNEPPISAPPVSAPPTPVTDPLFSDGSKVLLVLGSHLITDPFGSRAAVGRIKNIGPNALSYVRVDIPLYDGHGKQVGTTAASVNSLKSGKVWRFRADAPQNTATDGEIKYVTTY